MIENKNLPKLPKGWLYITLNEISEKITDGSHNPPPKQTKGVPMLSARNINNNHIDFEKIRYIKDEDFDREYKRAPVEPRDVLLTIVGTIGRSAVVEKNTPPFSFQRSVALIKPKINPNYLCYYFQSIFCHNYLLKNSKGTAQKGIYLNQLEKLPIPLCPLLEQKRIVAKIEELFTKLDASFKDLMNVKNKIDIYKKSVLKVAFEGKLIELKDGVINTTLSEEFDIIMGQSPKSTHYNKNEEGLPFFQGKKEFTNLYAEIQQWSRKANKIAEKDDVLLSVRAPIGPVNLAPTKCGIGRGLAAIKPNSKTNSKLIFYLLNIHEVELEKRGTGTTFRAITKPRLYSLPITLPISKEDRASLLHEIESRFSVIDKLEETVSNALTKQERLKKSILKNAFEGQLVPQDPTDESAEVMLKRIKNESEEYEQMRLT